MCSAIDYSRFRFRAEVDWLEIEIGTARPTNFATVRRRGGVAHVTALDAVTREPLPKGRENSAASLFRFRVQAPTTWEAIEQVLARLTDAFGLTTEVVVTGIEVSLDAYAINASRDDLVHLAVHFHRFNTLPASTNRRFSGRWRGDVIAAANGGQVARRISEGRVLNVGNASDFRSQRTYLKTTDNNGQVMDQRSHRARFENTLRGPELPGRSPLEWQTFNFCTLAALFRFRTLRDDLTPLQTVSGQIAEQLGERKSRNRKGGGTRLFSKLTRADTVLNRRAYDALKELSRRWQGRGLSRSLFHERPTVPHMDCLDDCGNVGDTTTLPPLE
jgi:hypothetical protein